MRNFVARGWRSVPGTRSSRIAVAALPARERQRVLRHARDAACGAYGGRRRHVLRRGRRKWSARQSRLLSHLRFTTVHPHGLRGRVAGAVGSSLDEPARSPRSLCKPRAGSRVTTRPGGCRRLRKRRTRRTATRCSCFHDSQWIVASEVQQIIGTFLLAAPHATARDDDAAVGKRARLADKVRRAAPSHID